MDFLFNLLPHLVNGVALGLLFALIALGFMLIIGVMEVINLAHGSLFALGAYMALVIVTPDGGLDLPFLQPWFGIDIIPRYIAGLVFAPVIVGVFGMGLELCLRRTYGKDSFDLH
jgi:branched-chain amino acid transport system permease protein